MSVDLYEVIFQGQIHQDAELNQVKARIGKLFKADEVTVARLFSGKRVVIKSNLSAEAADKYSIAFARAGAICELALVAGNGDSAEPAADRSAVADGETIGRRKIGKIAAVAAIAIVVVAAAAGVSLYLAGFFTSG